MANIDLLVLGDVSIDYFNFVSSIPKLNHSAKILDVKKFYGGMGANTAVISSKLGLKTALVSVIGQNSPDLLKYLEETNLKLFVKSYLADTSKSSFYKDRNTQISFFYKGVTELLDDLEFTKEFEGRLPDDVKVLYLARTYLKLHGRAVERYPGAFKVWNPGYGVFEMTEISDDFMKTLGLCDVFILNEHELSHLRSLGFKMDFEKSPAHIIETKGVDGCFVYSKNTQIDVKAFETKEVDSTGAGDAFNAGFISAQLKGFDFVESTRIGNVTASFVVEDYGCQEKTPVWEDIMKRYNEIR